MNVTTAVPLPRVRERIGAFLSMLVELFKLRVVALLVFSSIAGALAVGAAPDAMSMLNLIVAGTLAAAGSSAVNEYIERDRDALMRRTNKRPLPMSRFTRPGGVLAIGLGLIIGATALSLWNGAAQAVWVALGAFIYVAIYTLWLKPRSVLNIVIGGAAGSAAVISGGAAAGAWNHPAVLLLGLLVFTWTPVHFWSLAIVHRNDYIAAGFPMLPARVDVPTAARWVALHTVFTAIAGAGLVAFAPHAALYAVFAAPSTAWLVVETIKLLRAPNARSAMSLFKFSNAYLGIVLLAVMLAFGLP
jgi:protoheme IX farnesyltransferase